LPSSGELSYEVNKIDREHNQRNDLFGHRVDMRKRINLTSPAGATGVTARPYTPIPKWLSPEEINVFG
jgi:hypothetical protein